MYVVPHTLRQTKVDSTLSNGISPRAFLFSVDRDEREGKNKQGGE